MELITHLTDYVSPIYNQSSKDTFSRLPFDKYLKILNFYTNQTHCDVNNYVLFRLNDIDNDVEFVNDYSTFSNSNTYNVVYYDTYDKSYLFQAFGFNNMYEIIISNQNRYVFVPVMFAIKDNKVGHATMLIIDKQTMMVRFFDSNGLTKGIINNNIIDKFIKTYFDIFNITFNETYIYIEQQSWLGLQNYNEINKYILNSSNLKNNDINTGHCMIFTLIIAHILSKDKFELNNIITELNKIKQNELLDLVMGYTERAIENLKLIDF